jgi:hypothetical protein
MSGERCLRRLKMIVGDLVVHRYDEERDIPCIGTILEIRKKGLGWTEALIMWSSPNTPIHWHDIIKLRLFSGDF